VTVAPPVVGVATSAINSAPTATEFFAIEAVIAMFPDGVFNEPGGVQAVIWASVKCKTCLLGKRKGLDYSIK